MEAVLPGFEKSLQQQAADSRRRAAAAEAFVRSQADQLPASVREIAPRDPGDDRKAIAAIRDSTNDRLVQRHEALLSRTDILLQPCDFSGEFVAHLAGASIIANQAAIRERARERDQAKARKLATTILDRMDSWGALPALACARSALARDPREWFIDRPNVLNYRAIRLPLCQRKPCAGFRAVDRAQGCRLCSEVWLA
jgi:hypothetical protein